jgi:hypothetical protein
MQMNVLHGLKIAAFVASSVSRDLTEASRFRRDRFFDS